MATYPSMFAGLTPAAEFGADVAQLPDPWVTSLGAAVTKPTWTAPDFGKYDTAALAGAGSFQVQLFDDSTGDWHVQSPYLVIVGGTNRVPDVVGMMQAAATSANTTAGLTTAVLNVANAAPVGTVVAQDPPKYALAPAGYTSTIQVSAGPGGGGGSSSLFGPILRPIMA